MTSVDISPQLKRITRAEEKGQQLGASIQAWQWNVSTRIAEDRLSHELVLNTQPAPRDDWDQTFSEAVHHLRSALDNLAVSLAQQGGATDAQIRKTSFPITETQHEWALNGRAKVRHLPVGFQRAIELIQPFQRGETELRSDLLLILRDLDNQDKHRFQVVSELEPTSIVHMVSVEFETEADAVASIPPDIEINGEVPLEGEAVLVCQRTKGRIAKVWGEYEFSAQVKVVLPGGHSEGITNILAGLCRYTRIVVNYVAGTSAAQPGDA